MEYVDRMIMNGELVKLWKELVLVLFEETFGCLPEDNVASW
jgi:hypothetical protein